LPVRRLIKISAFSLMSVLTVLLVAGVAFYLRLANGPVALDFMTDTIQEQINSNLSGMSVTIGGAVVERSGENGVPHFRLRNIELKDDTGNLIARAPRAAIGINEQAIFSGQLMPTSLELIGPRIRVMRSLDGQIELGFGEAAPEDQTVTIDATPVDPSGKSDQLPAPVSTSVETAGGTASLIRILSGGGKGGGSISSIETIRVADAEIRFYDEANDSIWNIPKAELVFQRMPYGFAVASNAEVSNGPQQGTWHADVSASYRRESKSFSVSLRVSDLIPSNISDEIFALSQLARVKVPLAGQVEMEITEAGLVTKASAEFSASAGEVGLPDYLAEPIIIDEGSLRADYDPVTGSLIITDSTMLVGSSRAQVKGNIFPVRDAEGRLQSLKISLQARNVAIDAQGSNKSPVAVDRIEFVGNAAMEEARLDIEDLVVMSGDTGIRIRGAITGGNESAGILLSGRIRGLSAALMKQLWPPIMAPKTRNWVNQNIRDGRITEGEFQVNLPVDALAKALRNRRLPEKSINLAFRMADVTTGYLKDLPPLTKATGEAKLVDNDFFLKVDEAEVTLASGRTGRLAAGTMAAREILGLETIGEFDLDVQAAAPTLIEYLSHPALNLIRNTGFDTTKLSGDTKLKVKLSVPFIKDVPRERVIVDAKAHISKAKLEDALPGIDLTEGEIELSVEEGAFKAAGPAKIAGVPAKLVWTRAAGAGAKQSAVIETKLDGEQRKKIGLDLGTFLRGPIGIKATIDDLGDPQGKIELEADLGEAEMRITAINWVRPATSKTTAKLTYYGKGEKGRRVEDLVVKGQGVSIKGGVSLNAKGGGLREAKLTEVRLSDENIFALGIKTAKDSTAITITGDSFDARPLIRAMFGSSKSGAASGGNGAAADAKQPPVSISINLDRVYANRGELITGVTGEIRSRGSRLETAEINGTFLSGQPVVFRVTPVSGGREMRINGRDGGAAIRAANLYSKIAGGQIEFYALLSNDQSSSVKQGQLVLRDFEVRNEATLAELDSRGKPKKSGPRRDSLSFKRLTLPFSSDAKFIRIGDSLVRGNELGASAEGVIRKSDGAIDITGTIIPVYALNSMLSEIPLVGDILTGGKGQGIIGVTFALGGNVDKPVFQMNPVSAVAPGILRKFFEYGNSGAPPPPRNRNADSN
jgi:hypothetical protein